MTRILWNRRPGQPDKGHVDRRGDIDEIVINPAASVHIEQMDDRCWWVCINVDDERYWMGNFVADSRGRMRFVEQENAGIVWDLDQTHEADQ